jgi:DNA-binding CsgD family transcriptional regulator
MLVGVHRIDGVGMDVLMERGRRALAQRGWEEARAVFLDVVDQAEVAEAWEGLAVAARWLGRCGEGIEAGERAFRLYRGGGEDEAAARVAAFLALDVAECRGDTAVAAGWLVRARDLLRDRPDSVWVSAVDGIEGGVAGVYDRDYARARRLLDRAADGARRGGNLDAEMLARAQLGLVQVLSGAVVEGMRLLDGATAAAVSGEMTDAASTVAVCCLLTVACLSVRDLERAAQWSGYAMDVAASRGGGTLFDYPRTDLGTLLVLRGEWGLAEKELRTVVDRAHGRSRPALLARLRLADLRCRQGRFDEAATLLDVVEGTGAGWLGPMVKAGRAAWAWQHGDAAETARLAEACLGSLPRDSALERIDVLGLLARSGAAMGELDTARSAAQELAGSVEMVGTTAVRGAGHLAAGVVARAGGDLAAARRALDRAGDLFAAAGMPYEAGECWVELADCLLELGLADLAAAQARSAAQTFDELGATHAGARARGILAQIEPAARGRPDLSLTRREVEVLGLLGRGESNEQIAARLHLSVRTVEQHVANIYGKIGASGRTARAVATGFAHRNNIV